MARPIIPVQIRREYARGPLEVMSKTGLWVTYDYLSDPSRAAVTRACRVDGFTIPSTVFSHTFGEIDERAPMDDVRPPEVPADSDAPTEPAPAPAPQDGDESDNDAPPQPPSQSSASDQPTIEDIVRRIAGEMDDSLAEQIDQEVRDRLADLSDEFTSKLADLTVAPSPDAPPVITRVELVQNEVVMPTDGLFHQQFPRLLRAVSAGIHCYLPGPPGSGKSHAAEQVATVLGWRFASISLGPTTPESRLWGGMDAHGKFFEPPFVQLARHAMENIDSGAIYCLDEMDNGHAGIIATLNSALANGWFNAPNGDRITMGRNFVIVAAANTFGTGPTAQFAGRNKLDAATLDRFSYLPWDTDYGVEATMCRSFLHGDNAPVADSWLAAWRTLRDNVANNGLQVFVTMRGCLNGARLLAAGFSMDEAMNMVIGSKVPEDQWRRVNPL